MNWVTKHTILLATVGSKLHGTSLDDNSDRDEMGVCIEPQRYVIGLDSFQEHVYRTAEDRHKLKMQLVGAAPLAPGETPPSQAGDIDRVIYSLRKFCKLALSGNPTLLTLLFAPSDRIKTRIGLRLQRLAPAFVSARAGEAFRGYLMAQKYRLLGERGQKNVNRPELVEKYGYDTKFAYHALRLGLQGIELMKTGQLMLPMAQVPDCQYLLDVRRGKFPLEDVAADIDDFEAELKDAIAKFDGPKEGDHAAVNTFLVNAYEEHWKAHQFDEVAA